MTPIRVRCFAIVVFTVLSLVNMHAASVAREQRKPSQPDVVVIVMDDLPSYMLPFMPNVNALLTRRGVSFTNAIVSTPICCPSRASILTGQYGRTHDVIDQDPPFGGAARLDDSSTLAVWMRDKGYRTGMIGKYLNRYGDIDPYVPPGWDDWHAVADNGPTRYYRYSLAENGRTISYGTDPDDYLTTVLTRKALDFIDDTGNGNPLFLYYAPPAPHEPAVPAPEDIGMFSTLPLFRPASYNEADVRDKPTWIRRLPLITDTREAELEALYRSMVESLQSVDRSVAAIVDALDAAGRLDDAVIVFTSDNGYSLGEHRFVAKGCSYESCIRVPLIVRAPDIAPHTDHTHLIQNVDIAPTILDLAGIHDPKQSNGHPMDGQSFRKLMLDPSVDWRSAALIEVFNEDYARLRDFQGVRSTTFMYAEYVNGDRELYDLRSDPDELTNVVNNPAYSSIAATLRQQLDAYKATTDLAVTMAASTNSAAPGSTVTYTITVRNLGSHTTNALVVDDVLPSQLTYVSCTKSQYAQCVNRSPTIRLFWRALLPGQTETVELVTQVKSLVQPGVVIRNTVTTVPFTTVDPVQSNDTATAGVTVR